MSAPPGPPDDQPAPDGPQPSTSAGAEDAALAEEPPTVEDASAEDPASGETPVVVVDQDAPRPEPARGPSFQEYPWRSLGRWLRDPLRPVATRPGMVTLAMVVSAGLALTSVLYALSLLVDLFTGGGWIDIVLIVLLAVLALMFGGVSRGLLIGDPSAAVNVIRLFLVVAVPLGLNDLRLLEHLASGELDVIPGLIAVTIVFGLLLATALLLRRGTHAVQAAEYAIRTQELRGFRPDVQGG